MYIYENNYSILLGVEINAILFFKILNNMYEND